MALHSDMIHLTWSHGEADVNKMEISMVQQPAEVKKKNKSKLAWMSGELLANPGLNGWNVYLCLAAPSAVPL